MNRQDDIKVTAAEAAAELDVDRDTIDTWKRRGYLQPIPGSGRPARFWLSEVFACEAARRVHWKRRKG
ncbi:hypothetical protein [Nocardiopsis sp. TNDT3]|uniref:hypothetical protein n=1 Tax=Nocardiopsis sp. TNDT3 TaxID=2249354 RepID=UPI000E3BF3E9|nr:hypothetical protein [Nocardiopsis sp. TNDT3]